MNPTDRPVATQSARNSSTREDDGSRSVKIVGHISRPVVGEGRQTPDRQMFFVNSRPCNLPQVAKAFNEVYKSFNITQSPFVFADIKLDTNAYDVNVSPDKRTIMLHDQTALLESLKEALLELFDSHDQSVPQAQLLERRTTSAAKPPSVLPRGSIGSTLDEERSGSVGTNDILKQPTSTVEVTSLPETPTNNPRPGFIKASLIERFAGRDTEDRVTLPPVRGTRSSPEAEKIAGEHAFHSNRRQRTSSPGFDHTVDPQSQKPQSPLFEPELIESDVPVRLSQPSRAVQDFNARIASQHTHQERDRSKKSQVPVSDEDDAELAISTVKQTPQKPLSQSSIQNAFDRMRPMRTPIQTATITVGDTTTVSTIGTSSRNMSSRRSRIHTPKFSLSGQPLSQTPKRALFMKGLSAFAAPGTQVHSSDEESYESEGDSDSNMVDETTRSPSPHKHVPPEALEEAQAGNMPESPSTSSLPPQLIQQENVDGELIDPQPQIDRETDDEYMDESEKKSREEAQVAQMIADAEKAATRPTDLNEKRASKLFKVTPKKHWTINLERVIEIDVDTIARHLQSLQASIEAYTRNFEDATLLPTDTQLNKDDPEERLSLTVTKPDFKEMRIVGQFNLGFIIAVRPPTSTSSTADLFIIDQHASDEKYNFERLSATTTLVSQRLVHAHPLELTAVEEEIILANKHALTANGFVVEVDSSSEEAGRRAKLTSLPMSKEVTFTPTDLEELLALILDNPPSSSMATSTNIPRPSKVRKLLASRACRSSVMIGKTLQHARMREIVRQMSSMDKPWSCPHGRPTMRHLYGLEKWQGWTEGDGVIGVDVQGEKTDWAGFLKKNKR